MSLKKNIFANYVGTALVVLAPLLALPYYLNELGPTVWGLVSFIATFQVILSLIDAGISQILLTEFAKTKNALHNTQYKLGMLLFGFEKVYWCFAITVGFLVFIFSSQIADNWLKVDKDFHDQAQLAVIGAGAIFAFQFPGSIYRSFLLGTQNQILLNVILSVSSFSRHAGGVFIVLNWPSLKAYLLWHGGVFFVETIVRAFYAWNSLNVKRSFMNSDAQLMKRMLRPIMNTSGAVLLGVLAIQIDKIVLTKMVTVDKFGYYAIASMIAMGIIQLLYPVVNALIPYAVKYKDDAYGLRSFNLKYAAVVLVAILFFSLVFIFFGLTFLNLWLNNELAAHQIYLLLNWLLIGSALNALYTIGYINWLIKGQTFKIFKVNLITLIVTIGLTPVLVINYGLFGACFGWIALNAIGLSFSINWLIPKRPLSD